MKHIKTFESTAGTADDGYYYNSVGTIYDMREIKELEVADRGNYTPREFNSWLKKYNITLDTPAVWVCKTIKDTEPYVVNDGDGMYRVPRTDGYLIEESDDGDGGFIMILTNPKSKFEWFDIE